MKTLKLFLLPVLDSLEFGWQVIRYARIFVSAFFQQRASLGCEMVAIRSQLSPEKDFTNLVEYDQRLDDLFQKQPALCGICQYHKDTLPQKCVRQGFRLHDDLRLANPRQTEAIRLLPHCS
jgi:hypothetical protein